MLVHAVIDHIRCIFFRQRTDLRPPCHRFFVQLSGGCRGQMPKKLLQPASISKPKEDNMIVRKFRLDNGWTQEQLAEITQLSVRTIQRMERGRKSSLESLQARAAAFDTDVS